MKDEICVVTTNRMRDIKLIIPEHLTEGDENASIAVQFLCACAAKWKSGDVQFVHDVVKWFWRRGLH